MDLRRGQNILGYIFRSLRKNLKYYIAHLFLRWHKPIKIYSKKEQMWNRKVICILVLVQTFLPINHCNLKTYFSFFAPAGAISLKSMTTLLFDLFWWINIIPPPPWSHKSGIYFYRYLISDTYNSNILFGLQLKNQYW